MNENEISFENLSKAIAHLANEIAEIKTMVQNVQITKSKERSIPIGIDEVSRIIGKAKPTIYTLVRQRQIPSYKYGKKLYFFEEEILEWITRGKKKTIQEIEAEVFKYESKIKR
jgi:excisionase family DNA binding protein